MLVVVGDPPAAVELGEPGNVVVGVLEVVGALDDVGLADVDLVELGGAVEVGAEVEVGGLVVVVVEGGLDVGAVVPPEDGLLGFRSVYQRATPANATTSTTVERRTGSLTGAPPSRQRRSGAGWA
ncbi:MAG: hypothetical protein ACRDYD_10315 [Acidimicrobiales bacterium]